MQRADLIMNSGDKGRNLNKVESRTRPGANSLWLLPLGPDQIGEATAHADFP
jgi:hypothetical protein